MITNIRLAVDDVLYFVAHVFTICGMLWGCTVFLRAAFHLMHS